MGVQMVLSHRFNEALSYAESLHREQKRKGTDIPYVSHLLIVSSLVLENGGSEDQAIAALLHDAVEDQGGESRLTEIREKYGESVAQIVADCTDAWVEPKPEWRVRKVSYINSLQKKDASSLLVSLADKTHNAEAILQDYKEIGDALWKRFNAGKEGTLWYYGQLSEQFNALLPGRLANRLTSAVSGFSEK